MSFFSNLVNILKAYIDKASKELYKVKNNFYVFALLVLALGAAVSSSVVVCDASGSFRASEPISVNLESLPSSDGKLRLSLSVDGVLICGMRAVVRYDTDAVALKEVVPDGALACQGGVLSFAEGEGETVIVIDACENYTEEELGILIFEAFSPCLGREISFEVQVEELYFWSNDALVAAELPRKEEILVVIPDFVTGNGSFDLAVETRSDGEMVELILRAVAPDRCFAAGFEVYVLEIVSLESQRFSMIGVLGGDATEERIFSHAVGLSRGKGYCVVIKPVVYFGGGAVIGQEIVVVIDDGSIVN